MRAIVISTYGGPEVLTAAELPDPEPAAGEVLIRVKAFGLNHAETYLRSGAWGDVARVTGIEAAGTVEADPSGVLPPGTQVVAILGGMGRTRNGSYAELVTVPTSNVALAPTDLTWAELAAVPEAYATAWSALHLNLGIKPGETVLVRGGTSAVGQAAVNLAVDHGATVVATTRNPARIDLLTKLGAAEVLIENGALAPMVRDRGIAVRALLDLVGNTVFRDSVATVVPRGRVCQIGFLGGFDAIKDFDPIVDMPTGVRFSTYLSAFALGTPAFPLAEVPLADIFAKVAAGTIPGWPVRLFDFDADDLVEAHRIMEAGTAGGKMVVTVD
jgi:NADPH:quinone reductase